MKSFPTISVLAILLFVVSFRLDAKEGWIIGAEYQNVSGQVDYFGTHIDFDVGVLNAYLGYQTPLSQAWSMITTMSLGTSIKQDNNNQVVVFGDILADVDIEVSNHIRLQSQFDYALSDTGALFIAPGISQYDYTAKHQGFEDLSISDWQLSLSAGYVHRVGAKSAIRAAYTHLSDTDVLSLAYEHRF